MKRPGEIVTLTRHDWTGPEPEPFDGLRTSTGRQYEILEVKGRKLVCRVMRQGETIEGRTFNWHWTRR